MKLSVEATVGGCVCGTVDACVAESELHVCDGKRWSRSLHLMTHSLDVRHWIWCFKHYKLVRADHDRQQTPASHLFTRGAV